MTAEMMPHEYENIYRDINVGYLHLSELSGDKASPVQTELSYLRYIVVAKSIIIFVCRGIYHFLRSSSYFGSRYFRAVPTVSESSVVPGRSNGSFC